jgi:hypothetical protein
MNLVIVINLLLSISLMLIHDILHERASIRSNRSIYNQDFI